MMTRKHFEALAVALKEARRVQGCPDEPDTFTLAVADVCARFNPNFDRARFLKACGVEEAK